MENIRGTREYQGNASAGMRRGVLEFDHLHWGMATNMESENTHGSFYWKYMKDRSIFSRNGNHQP